MVYKGIKCKGGFLFLSLNFRGKRTDELENIHEPMLQKKYKETDFCCEYYHIHLVFSLALSRNHPRTKMCTTNKNTTLPNSSFDETKEL